MDGTNPGEDDKVVIPSHLLYDPRARYKPKYDEGRGHYPDGGGDSEHDWPPILGGVGHESSMATSLPLAQSI